MKYQTRPGLKKLRLMSLCKTAANMLKQAPNQETAKEQVSEAHDISETLWRKLVAIARIGDQSNLANAISLPSTNTPPRE